MEPRDFSPLLRRLGKGKDGKEIEGSGSDSFGFYFVFSSFWEGKRIRTWTGRAPTGYSFPEPCSAFSFFFWTLIQKPWGLGPPESVEEKEPVFRSHPDPVQSEKSDSDETVELSPLFLSDPAFPLPGFGLQMPEGQKEPDSPG